MLFNSHEFVFAFFPIALVLFGMFGSVSRGSALAWITIASLTFYAWWRPENLLIIVPSICINFALAKAILRLRAGAGPPSRSTWVLAAGVIFNVALLGYFKYFNFFVTVANDVGGTQFGLEQIILPLGISFITFQIIAFLFDSHAGRVDDVSFREFALFVLFFPQLIAGPIVHFREMMPQYRTNPHRLQYDDLAVGLSLFCIGLFKKVVLADGIAPHVTPLYAAASAGGEPAFFAAWIASLGFTLQIYFDFSAYSDMAVGLARCFGLRLPINFDSPLKASSIIDFWARWHITLTRFLTAYLYNPLALAATRRRLKKGLRPLTPRHFSWPAFLQLLAIPTLVTMFVSGLWHGAGYLFITWGLLHGIYLTINHAWRFLAQRWWSDRDAYARIMRPIGFVLTFLAVAVSMVVFRADSGAAAFGILKGMAGLNGIALPESILASLGSLGSLFSVGTLSLTDLAAAFAWIAGLLLIALLLPNSIRLMERFEPVVSLPKHEQTFWTRLTPSLAWQPSLVWLAVTACGAWVAVDRLSGQSEFLYWQF